MTTSWDLLTYARSYASNIDWENPSPRLLAALSTPSAPSPIAIVDCERAGAWYESAWRYGYQADVISEAKASRAAIVIAPASARVVPHEDAQVLIEHGPAVMPAPERGNTRAFPTLTALRRALDTLGKPTPDLRGDLPASVAAPTGNLFTHTAPPFPEAVATASPIRADQHEEPGVFITRTLLSPGAWRWDSALVLDHFGRAAFIRLLAAYARLAPVFPSAPPDVEVRRSGDTLVLFNHADRAREVAGVSGFDVASRQEVRGHVALPPRSAIVLIPSGD